MTWEVWTVHNMAADKKYIQYLDLNSSYFIWPFVNLCCGILLENEMIHLKGFFPDIAHLRPSLSLSAAETLIHAFITSSTGAITVFMVHHPKSLINSSTSRALLLTCKLIPMSSLFSIDPPVHSKILLFTFKALHDQTPSYLTDPLRHKPLFSDTTLSKGPSIEPGIAELTP